MRASQSHIPRHERTFAGTRRRAGSVFAAALVLGAMAATAHASPVSLLVYKLGVDASGSNAIDSLGAGVDAYSGWADSGGFNLGNATAQSLANDTLDYKNSWVDSATNWATVTSVTVGMYQNGAEQAYMTFSAGTDKLDFYAAANLTGTSYTDLSAAGFSGNIFSAAGDQAFKRLWFVENNYGGCRADAGWFVVLDTDNLGFCHWERGNKSADGRAFLFADDNTSQNWNSDDIGKADVFAVTVTYNPPVNIQPIGVPEPASGAMIAGAVLGLAFLRRRRPL